MGKKKTDGAAEAAATDTDMASTGTFEQSLAALEQIVASLEGGQLGLGESLEAYEAGIAQLKACHRHLQAAERRVELLSGFDADGNAVTEPLAEGPTSLEQKQASRARRRTAAACDEPSMDDPPGLF